MYYWVVCRAATKEMIKGATVMDPALFFGNVFRIEVTRAILTRMGMGG